MTDGPISLENERQVRALEAYFRGLPPAELLELAADFLKKCPGDIEALRHAITVAFAALEKMIAEEANG